MSSSSPPDREPMDDLLREMANEISGPDPSRAHSSERALATANIDLFKALGRSRGKDGSWMERNGWPHLV